MFKIRVYQGENEKIITAGKGENLLELLLQNNFIIDSPCGGMGICGKCRVKIIDEFAENTQYRLACKTIIDQDMTVEIPDIHERAAQIVTEGEVNTAVNPSVKKRAVELKAPDIQEQISDVEQIESSIGAIGSMPNDIMPHISNVLRSSDFKVTVAMYENQILSVEPYNTENKKYGIAVDIGTTTIVGYLMNLSTGEQIGVYSSLNPQSKYGADVITRIDYTLNSNGLTQMTDLIRNAINRMINHFCQKYEIAAENIYEIDIVGNTVMMHIFAGLPVKNIALSPFVPVVCRKIEFTAKDIDINICSGGKVVILPSISSYVGADAAAAVLACNMHKSEKVNLLIDIGTNGEIVLGSKTNMLVCSTAAGPAFEGARIECGLGGVQGAINRVFIDDNITYSTIGGASARGICGSGIIDVTAQMLKAGLLEPSGRMLTPEEVLEKFPSNISNKMFLKHEQPALLLKKDENDNSQDIYISQKDIREVQLAKAAIAAGIAILMKEMSISYNDISCVYLTGGFGNYMDYRNALKIGLIPEAFRDKIYTIGNGAGMGAKIALLSKDGKAETEIIKEKAKYIELSAREDFQEYFIDFLNF